MSSNLSSIFKRTSLNTYQIYRAHHQRRNIEENKYGLHQAIIDMLQENHQKIFPTFWFLDETFAKIYKEVNYVENLLTQTPTDIIPVGIIEAVRVLPEYRSCREPGM